MIKEASAEEANVKKIKFCNIVIKNSKVFELHITDFSDLLDIDDLFVIVENIVKMINTEDVEDALDAIMHGYGYYYHTILRDFTNKIVNISDGCYDIILMFDKIDYEHNGDAEITYEPAELLIEKLEVKGE
jgi:hypothetical protein